MNNMLSVIYFILILSALIVIHELGHLITAKRFGVYCSEFSIGMGPAIYKHQFKETAFSIRLLPIGGFVAMAGEEGVEDEHVPFERTIKGINVWKQVVIMAAGAVMNILLAWALFIGLTMYQGSVALPPEPVINGTMEGSPAKAAGFQAGDRIIEVTSHGISFVPENMNEITEHIQYYPEETTFKVQRGAEVLDLVMTPSYIKEENRYLIGIEYSRNIKEIGVLEAFGYGTQQLIESSTSIFRALGNIIRGIGLNNLSGPVGIYKITADTIQYGWMSVLALIALLSVNLGIMNLLPLPVLDGGRIFITLLEKISGRKLGEKAEYIITMAGVVLLVGIMVFATWQDITRLFG